MSIALEVVATILKGFDLLAWLVTLGPMWMAMAKSKVPSIRAQEIGKEDVNGPGNAPSPVFRSTLAVTQGKLTTQPCEGVTTCYELTQRAAQRYSDRRALGTRRLLDIKVEEGMRFPTKVFGETDWLTYKQVNERAHNFGSGLRALGVEPCHTSKDEDLSAMQGDHTILMYEDTCADWFTGAQGAHSQSIVVGTAYATLGVDSVMSAVNEASISTIFCNHSNVKKILAKKDQMPSLKNIIYSMLNVPPAARDTHPGTDATVKVLSFDEVVDLGKDKAFPPSPPSPSDVAILMYTSGSTGKPKGVMVRHSQIVCLLGAIKDRAEIGEGEVLVGFLPLAHIFEMQMEWYAYGFGGAIGYADPKTLVAGPGKCEPTGALKHFRPTVIGAVPKVWEVIKAGVEAKIKAGGPTKEFLFNAALEWKKAALPHYRDTYVFDKLVFSKITENLGGRLRLAVSGGGAISGPVQEWVRTVLGVPLIQGYGLTETCAGLTVQSPSDWRCGVVGAPIDTVDVLLHSEAEICDADNKPYLATDTKHFDLDIKGRGEVWVRGNNITDGYYKMSAETLEAYDKESGWFKTGDIGIMLPDGTLRIVDRKKNLVKLKGGEYIALERMNLAFNTSPFVDCDAGGVCSYGDHEMDRPVALVQINKKAVLDLAKSLGIESEDIEVVKNDAKVHAEVIKSLTQAGKQADPPLTALETLAGVALLTKPFSPDEGTLTASLKLVPKRIAALFDTELQAAKKKGIR
eukprot:TRINITY_DN812_c5_g1_i1.p2 TRINITY_DN812_c5_g1~~TRINITY_DN812_c5_g1_i1.p2  ORF type:complete len:742 (+),score=334.51 TRINITY_DN812_c5_g1_i1:54-2279(+)